LEVLVTPVCRNGACGVFSQLLATPVSGLKPSDQIVLVSVLSAHRKDAFSACEFIMDYLKTDAPFWKKEVDEHGEKWVEAKASDADAREAW
jgi:molybdopterin synthase catalytic subunit